MIQLNPKLKTSKKKFKKKKSIKTYDKKLNSKLEIIPLKNTNESNSKNESGSINNISILKKFARKIKEKEIAIKQDDNPQEEMTIESLSTRYDSTSKTINSPFRTTFNFSTKPSIEEIEVKSSTDNEVKDKNIILIKIDEKNSESKSRTSRKISSNHQSKNHFDFSKTNLNIKRKNNFRHTCAAFSNKSYFSELKQQTEHTENIISKKRHYHKLRTEIKNFEKESTINYKSLQINSVPDFSSITQTKFTSVTPRAPAIMPLFKSRVALNRFLIRDFLIGNTGNSKKKMELTMNMDEYFEEKKKKKIKKVKDTFEIQKYGAVIMRDNSDNDSINDKNVNEDEKLKKNLKKMYLKQRAKIIQRSKKIGELIDNLSDFSYEKIDTNQKISSPLINKRNLERVIRVRNIIKNKIDTENDYFGINTIKKLNKENDKDLMTILRKVGPPTFLKTRFKNSTIQKYKIINGNYFGCMV